MGELPVRDNCAGSATADDTATGGPSTDAQERLERRYRRAPSGAPDASRHPLASPGVKGLNRARFFRRAATVAALVLALGITAWLAFGRGPTATERVLGYTVTDETQTTVTFQVSKEPSRAAQCQAQALDSSYGIVGWLVVDIPPAQAGTTTHTIEIRTDSLAVTGTVDECWVLP